MTSFDRDEVQATYYVLRKVNPNFRKTFRTIQSFKDWLNAEVERYATQNNVAGFATYGFHVVLNFIDDHSITLEPTAVARFIRSAK
jgi:hypothetical protein